MDMETLDCCLICRAPAFDFFDPDYCIVRCRECGLIFENPRPTLQSIINFYSEKEKYSNWLFEEAARDDLWKRRLQLLRKLNLIGPLLDIGAGIGQFLFHAQSDFLSVYGTEVSKSAVEIARKKYGLELIHNELTNIDWGSQKFNTITMFHVVEHLHNPKETLQRCHELLAPGGRLVVAVPNELYGLSSKIKHLLKLLGVRRFQKVGKLGLRKLALDGSVPEIHLVHFTPKTLKNALTRAGFSIVEVGLDPYFVATGIHKLIHKSFYNFASIVLTLSDYNLYSTIWVIAQKNF